MRNTKNLKSRFSQQILNKEDQQAIKGGFSFSLSEEQLNMLDQAQEAMKMSKELCKKAWEKAKKDAKKAGYTLTRDNGNGSGIW